MLTFLWKRITDEGGTVSNTRQKAQPRMWFWNQTWTGTNLQHNTLQSTSLRLVCVFDVNNIICVYFRPLSCSSPTSLSSSLIIDENCRDRRHNCVMVVQARLCVYSYYKTACCASCTQSAQRAKRHWPANHREPRCARSQGLGQRGWSPLQMTSL